LFVFRFSTPDDDMKMTSLSTRFFRWRIQESPDYGLKLGISDFADEVEEYTETAFEQQKVSPSLSMSLLLKIFRNKIV